MTKRENGLTSDLRFNSGSDWLRSRGTHRWPPPWMKADAGESQREAFNRLRSLWEQGTVIATRRAKDA